MQGRTALAALLLSAALSACGQEAGPAPARIEITSGPAVAAATAAPAAAPPARRGRVRTGTLRTRPKVPKPQAASTPASTPRVPAANARPTSARRFRATQLRALRAYCATRPADDPRCVDGRVDERVAFAAFEVAR